MDIQIWLYTLASVLVVSVLSLVGILTLSMKAERLKKLLIYFVSFAVGALLGDAFIHLLPEITEEIGFGLPVSLALLSGIAFFFVFEKVIHWRHNHIPLHLHHEDHTHPLAIMNLLGDGIHNFIDGIIIGVSYLASIPVGIATTIAVILHEIPQEIGDFGVLLHAGLSKGRALFYNFCTAAVAILGAVLALLLGSTVENFTNFVIPFAAGGFIYIAGADLIPELHKEVKLDKSLYQFLWFCAGIGVMLLMLLLE